MSRDGTDSQDMMKTHQTGGPNDDRGFSLIEILIVIIVLGVLATIAVFAVRGITDRGESATCAEDRRVMLTAVESYFAQQGTDAIATSTPAVAGVTGTTPEATLVEFGMLRGESSLFDVAADGTVSLSAGSSC